MPECRGRRMRRAAATGCTVPRGRRMRRSGVVGAATLFTKERERAEAFLPKFPLQKATQEQELRSPVPHSGAGNSHIAQTPARRKQRGEPGYLLPNI